jgi:hypothetical protein
MGLNIPYMNRRNFKSEIPGIYQGVNNKIYQKVPGDKNHEKIVLYRSKCALARKSADVQLQER